MPDFHFSVNETSPKQDSPFYKYTTDSGCHEFRNVKTYKVLKKIINVQYEDREQQTSTDTRTKIIIYARPLDLRCGGIVAIHNLAKQINDLQNPKICAKLFIYNGLRYQNKFCEDFATIDEAQENNAIVVYPETISGNPLNCKKVVRWILLGLGKEMPENHYLKWDKNDLVYCFNSEEHLEKNLEKLGNSYKLLTTLYINSDIVKTNFNERNGVCFCVRKAEVIHKEGFSFVHPKNSFELTREHSLEEHKEFFNKYKWCIFYDPLTFYTIYAAICGCIPIVYKIEGMNKKQWIETTAAAQYLKSKKINDLYGIAYGQEDMQYAMDTIHLVKEQWIDILNYFKEKTLVPFLNDVQNFENMENNVATIFN